MKPRSISSEEIRLTGLKALLRNLGPDGLIRFLQQFGAGSGDYTRDRHLLLPDGDFDSCFPLLPNPLTPVAPRGGGVD